MTHVFASDEPDTRLLATKAPRGCGRPVPPRRCAARSHPPPGRVHGRAGSARAGRGARALEGPGPGADQSPPWPESQHDFDFEFLGLLALADPPRPEVPPALAQCRRAGVRVVMMTGDHPATARAIAQQVGLSARPEVLTGAELEALDDAALTARLRHVDLCARLTPAHKLRLVQLLVPAARWWP